MDLMPMLGKQALRCPMCRSEMLHHTTIEVFERTEDASTGLHVTIKDLSVTVNTDLAGNPSSRRHGFKVGFWCEECDETSVLSVEQHKGTTYFKMEATKRIHKEQS